MPLSSTLGDRNVDGIDIPARQVAFCSAMRQLTDFGFLGISECRK
jgi:hypothetical protein